MGDFGFLILDFGFQSEIQNPQSKIDMAERVGFEPTEPVKAHSISNAANSTTLAPFRAGINYTKKPGDILNGTFYYSPVYNYNSVNRDELSGYCEKMAAADVCRGDRPGADHADAA